MLYRRLCRPCQNCYFNVWDIIARAEGEGDNANTSEQQPGKSDAVHILFYLPEDTSRFKIMSLHSSKDFSYKKAPLLIGLIPNRKLKTLGVNPVARIRGGPVHLYTNTIQLLRTNTTLL